MLTDPTAEIQMVLLLSRRRAVAMVALIVGSMGAAVTAEPAAAERMLFFWGVGCPHCEEAKPFLHSLAAEYPTLIVEWIEVRHDAAGRARFVDMVRRLGIEGAGVPMFVVGDRSIVGFRPGVTEGGVRALLRGAEGSRTIALPIVGRVDPARVPFPLFTVVIGLLDGINPCAMWVLLVLLSILLRVRSRARLMLFGATFTVASGVVYFLFMTIWVGIFALLGGISRGATVVLGAALVGMGLVNLKDLFWFRKGLSLVVPEGAKPGVFRRMRAIVGAASLPAALLGIAALALVVNLVELGCTLGLPAVYTRLLTMRHSGTAARYGYLALYNLAYIVPLTLVVIAYVTALHRFVLGERAARLLKGVSGLLLLLFGLLFLLAPGALAR